MARALAALAMTVALVVPAAPAAHADDHDDAFLLALKRDGIVPVLDPASMIDWAHWACDQLDKGAQKEHIVVWMAEYHPPFSPDVELNAVFVKKAGLYYCPGNKQKAGS
jgi:uncharacterized protein DUF732